MSSEELYEDLKNQLQELKTWAPAEENHELADNILIRVALNTELTSEQRKELVSMYIELPKWFA